MNYRSLSSAYSSTGPIPPSTGPVVERLTPVQFHNHPYKLELKPQGAGRFCVPQASEVLIGLQDQDGRGVTQYQFYGDNKLFSGKLPINFMTARVYYLEVAVSKNVTKLYGLYASLPVNYKDSLLYRSGWG